MKILEVKDVSKKYGKKQVLSGVSFDIEEGDIFGLIGPNGAGKSTLINIITGILDPLNGEVLIGGHNIKKNPIEAKKLIGLVPQELALSEDISAIDNLNFFASLYGLSGKKLKDAVSEALEVTGLTEKKKEKVKKFSGGMKRRLNLAAAIMHKPRLLILDEPTVGIDPQSRNNIFEYLRKINSQDKTTILYTSHYMEEVEELCKNIFVIDEGREIAYGTLNSVKEKANGTVTLEIKADNINEDLIEKIRLLDGALNVEQSADTVTILYERSKVNLDETIKILQTSGAVIKALQINELNLGEVFLQLTGKKLRE
ncbi:ABC transporter ATP-binding protein [Treponema putidum]|uniref:ABC transporter ATP-binding protein n=1 Tax=Treponema putidum TaxID=221027 RepID=A0AAE9MSL9_9SPIR|nr:ABC transporter ATP-binding protein [Treponema putidum]AIN94023.1 antibiotic ABC transporter ATP-binding protein [Treponema putidum]TWI76980.1 ABC-2 type transport system ATP-binding protein [Treponema putidum]UTY27956.1 ABC transporter ATP-binding protein [Treponema putidum]UTY30400.1 ABC transporter ATP-binding protein [Treponema putidum]UTY32872.1 ABC transporter ATP-binding protein [Treponema putidum]